jgi:hypothetical protein
MRLPIDARTAFALAGTLLLLGAGAGGPILVGDISSVSETAIDRAVIFQDEKFSNDNVSVPRALVDIEHPDQTHLTVGAELSDGTGSFTTAVPISNQASSDLTTRINLTQTVGPGDIDFEVGALPGGSCRLTHEDFAASGNGTFRVTLPADCEDRLRITATVNESTLPAFYEYAVKLKPIARATAGGESGFPSKLETSANRTQLAAGESVKILAVGPKRLKGADVRIELRDHETGNVVSATNESLNHQAGAAAVFTPTSPGSLVGNVTLFNPERFNVSPEHASAETDKITVGDGDGGDGDDGDGDDGDGGGGGEELRPAVGDGRIVFVTNQEFADGGNGAGGDLRTLTQTGGVRFAYGLEEKVKAIGPSRADFDDDPFAEIPVVTTNPNTHGGNLVLVDTQGEVETIKQGRVKPGSVAVGSFSGDRDRVFFIESGTRDIRRITPETDTGAVTVSGGKTKAQGLAGIVDIDGDNETEIVFGGNGPQGNSNTVNFVDDDGSLVGTGQQYGSNNGAGVGSATDFDGDGVARVPIVDGNQRITLVNASGDTTELTGGSAAKKSPLGVTDFDNDENSEIVFLGTNGNLKYVDEVGELNVVVEPTDEDGESFDGIKPGPGLRGGDVGGVPIVGPAQTGSQTEAGVAFVEQGQNTIRVRNLTDRVDSSQAANPIKAIGGVTDLDGDASAEFPRVVGGDTTTLEVPGLDQSVIASDVKSQPVAVTADVADPGRFAPNAPSLYYAQSSDGAVVRVTPQTTPGEEVFGGVTAQATVGLGDIDADGSAELIFGGNGPQGNSDTINFIDDDGSLEGIGVGYGSDDSVGLGEPADFDGNGLARVPVVTGNQRIGLVDAAGRIEIVRDATTPKAALATADIDTDGRPEIVFVDSDGSLKYVDNVGSTNDIKVLATDVSVDSGVGVRGAVIDAGS